MPMLDVREWLGYEAIRELDLSNNCLRSSGANDVVNIARKCAKTLKGSIKLPNTQCDRSNRPGSHCKGPYTAKGYMLGAHGTGSVYMIHTAPALPRVKAKVGPPAAISNAVVLKNGNLQLNSRGFADLGNTLSPTTEMTLCMWVKLLRDHSSWHLLATKWDDHAPGYT